MVSGREIYVYSRLKRPRSLSRSQRHFFRRERARLSSFLFFCTTHVYIGTRQLEHEVKKWRRAGRTDDAGTRGRLSPRMRTLLIRSWRRGALHARSAFFSRSFGLLLCDFGNDARWRFWGSTRGKRWWRHCGFHFLVLLYRFLDINLNGQSIFFLENRLLINFWRCEKFFK